MFNLMLISTDEFIQNYNTSVFKIWWIPEISVIHNRIIYTDVDNAERLTHMGIIAGKLNGVMPAVTPIGSRRLYVSMSWAMFGNVSPRMALVILQQCSTTSIH